MKKHIVWFLLFAMLISGCAFAEEAQPEQAQAEQTQTEETQPEQTGEQLSLTTGLPTTMPYKPMVVSMDNNRRARPQKNLASADVVYEIEIAGGGYTRYMAVFNDTIPDIVESVRSTREIGVDICRDWDGTLIHYGGLSAKGEFIPPLLNSMGIDVHFNGLEDSKNFFRDSERVQPYNAGAYLKQIYDASTKVSEQRAPLKFSATEPTIKGDDATAFEINYSKKSGHCASYKYNAEDGLYYRYYNGEEHKDGVTGEQLTCSNVIIMYHEASYYNGDGNVPVIQATGTNKCEYFIGGKHFTGTWQRESRDTTTTYLDDEGNEVLLKPGKTYIQMLNQNKSVEITG